MSGRISQRKIDHLRICATKDVQSSGVTGFEDLTLMHNSLPEIDAADVELGTVLLDHHLSAPLVIEAMTGGAQEAKPINKRLAAAAKEYGIAMGVGSQRAAIEKDSLVSTFSIARETAPEAFLIANIGAPQLSAGYGVEEAKKAVEMISADALAIHLNPLQESIQPEGEAKGRGVIQKIAEIADNVDVPLIVKETGAGISGVTAKRLREAGASAIDVSGRGGTDWAKVEAYRPRASPELISKADAFSMWGISTVASILEVTQSTEVTVIASGGLRNGVDAAKSIALGATGAGFASQLLVAAMTNEKSLFRRIDRILDELKTAMFLTGSKTVEDLKRVDLVISGQTLNWAMQRGLDAERYARRTRIG
ncbi:MAG: type 2 isopentenyl-diphosphate Delta-isomerase [archaeon]